MTTKSIEFQGQLDALLHTLDTALAELAEARANRDTRAIALAAGRVSHITRSVDQIAVRLHAATKWETE